eukprot:scaffold48337_cov19-Tisochrysis_lutea.AAC.2
MLLFTGAPGWSSTSNFQNNFFDTIIDEKIEVERHVSMTRRDKSSPRSYSDQLCMLAQAVERMHSNICRN